MDCLNVIPAALCSVLDNVGHYRALQQTDQYAVWSEDGQADALWADGRAEQQVITGTIDYFTKMEEDLNFDKIQQALSDFGISWRLNRVQFEEDTKLIHYEWVWEI